MADNKNYNETLAQQRKARAELVKLKKAQSGEIEMKNETPLQAAMPKTIDGKIKNIWYHDKWIILGVMATIAVIVFLCVQCTQKEKYDLEAVAYTYTYITDNQLEIIVNDLEKYCEDIDGDGKANLFAVNCSFEKNSPTATATTEYSSSTKVQALLAADKQALVFITDEESYEFLNGISEDGLFEGKTVKLPESLYEKVEKETGLALPEGLILCYRRVSNTTLDKTSDIVDYYALAKNIVEKSEKEWNN